MTKKLLCFVFLTVSIFANAQNRYDTPANATFTNTYVPMTHEEMMLRAAAEVYREKRAREDFDKYSRTAYEYLQKKQILFQDDCLVFFLGPQHYDFLWQ